MGLMVQRDQCKDLFYPTCVGRTDKEVKELSTYYCPDCTLVEKALGLGGGECKGQDSSVRLRLLAKPGYLCLSRSKSGGLIN